MPFSRTHGCLFSILLLTVFLASSGKAEAVEADARQLLKRMSDYLSSLESFSFDFDAEHEVFAADGEKFGLRSSNSVAVRRPNAISIRKSAGFSDVSFLYNGETLLVQDSASAMSAEVPIAGDLDTLVDELRDTYWLPLPAADLIVSSTYDVLLEDVTEVKDLGNGVVNGVECDHLAFRNPQVDWQIWIASGDTAFPCLLVITTRDVAEAPQYRVSVSNWSEGVAVIPSTLDQTGFQEVSIETFQESAPAFPPNYSLEKQ